LSQNYCIECGASLVQDSNFCGKCGSDLRKQNEKELATSLKANVGPVADLTPEFSAISEVSQFDQKSSSIGKTLAAWIIGFVAFAALIIVIAAPNGDNEFEPASTSSSESSVETESIFDQDAANFISPGEAAVTLSQVWGISLNDENGPISLGDLADLTFLYSLRTVSNPNPSDIEIAFQPGNSMYSFFTRLLNDERALIAVEQRWIDLAS
jgi:ribosomal protein L40E